MKITVYVPCHNNESTVGQVLASLREQTRPADQFIFINDRCTDKSPEIARQYDFRILEMPGKKGLAAGRNCALAAAEGDILLGLDADVVIDKNYLEELEKRFAAMPQVVAVGGRVDEKFQDTPADLWRAKHMPQHFGPQEQVDTRILFGASMAGRVAVLRQLGGWNERFLTNFEDVDITTRIKKAGLHLLYTPACQAWHLRRDTPETVLKTFWAWNYFGYEHVLANLGVFLGGRLPQTWQRYRFMRIEDAAFPALGALDLRFPWEWIIRDLYVMRKTMPEIGNVQDVVQIARKVVTQYGMAPDGIERLVGRLQQLALSLEEEAASGGQGVRGGPLNRDIANSIYFGALESIPDGNYWRMNQF